MRKSLAEFSARRRKKIKIIFHRDMRVVKNTSQAASVEFCRKAAKLCAQQTAIPLAEKSKIFRQLYLVVKNALHHPGDAGGVGGDLQIPEAKGAHDAQHIIRLTDAHLEKKHSAGA